MNRKISIILSTYNEAKIIESTIREIFNKIDNVEIVLVDDNSKDGTLDKLKNINNPNLKIYSRKQRGLASAFLLGMINLRGMVLPIMDLRKRFEMSDFETGPFTVIIIVQIKNKVIGVVVDSVVDVVNLQNDNLLEAPDESTDLDAKFVKGLANLRGEMVILMDLEQLLAPEELEQLNMLR